MMCRRYTVCVTINNVGSKTFCTPKTRSHRFTDICIVKMIHVLIKPTKTGSANTSQNIIYIFCNQTKHFFIFCFGGCYVQLPEFKGSLEEFSK